MSNLLNKIDGIRDIPYRIQRVVFNFLEYMQGYIGGLPLSLAVFNYVGVEEFLLVAPDVFKAAEADRNTVMVQDFKVLETSKALIFYLANEAAITYWLRDAANLYFCGDVIGLLAKSPVVGAYGYTPEDIKAAMTSPPDHPLVIRAIATLVVTQIFFKFRDYLGQEAPELQQKYYIWQDKT